MADIAARVWAHRWKIDPIVRSLIDTDFYKLLMCQSVRRKFADARVTFSLINRAPEVRLAELIDEGELREQLDHVRTLSLSRGESTWLRGNTFYGKRQMFRPDFMEWFEGLRLPPYHLEVRDGQYELTFEGAWPEVMLWEVPALAVLMELRSRAVLNRMGKFELEILYARAMTKLWQKVERLKTVPDLRLADFGTRRLADKVNFHATYTNMLTASATLGATLPIIFETDREAVEGALKTIGLTPPERARVVRIKNTLDLAEMDVSESMLPEVQANPRLSQTTQLAPVVFDREGNLSQF